MPIVVYIKKSTNVNKKYDAYIHKHGELIKKLSFGQRGASDYTLHKDPARKASYLKRHTNEDPTNYLTPAFYATNLLWNKPSLSDSIKDTMNKYNMIIHLR
jgi:hypothetical protein